MNDINMEAVFQSYNATPDEIARMDACDPPLSQSIARMKAEVLQDVASGRVPDTVCSFSDLHDHVDANSYGGFCQDEILGSLIGQFGGRNADEGMPDMLILYLNCAQGAIHEWIKSGAMRAEHQATHFTP